MKLFGPRIDIKVKTVGNMVRTTIKHEGDPELLLAYLVSATDTLIMDLIKVSGGKLNRKDLYMRFGEMLISYYKNNE